MATTKGLEALQRMSLLGYGAAAAVPASAPPQQELLLGYGSSPAAPAFAPQKQLLEYGSSSAADPPAFQPQQQFLEYGSSCGSAEEEGGSCEPPSMFFDYRRKRVNRKNSNKGKKKPAGVARRRKSSGPKAKKEVESAEVSKANIITSGPRAAARANVRRLSGGEQKKYVARFGAKLLDAVPKGYQLVRKLGEGAFGVALLACKNQFECLVLKIQIVDDDRKFNHEVAMQKKFAAVGLAPQVLDMKTWNHRGQRIASIVMTKIDGILDSFLAVEQPKHVLDQLLVWITDAIKKMCDSSLTHADYHFSNLAYIVTTSDGDVDDDEEFVPVAGEEGDEDEFKATRVAVRKNEPHSSRFTLTPILIDFGWSSSGSCFPQLELIQALRTASRRYNPKMPLSNQKYMQDELYKLYTKNYNPKLSKTQEAYEKEWDKLMDKQVEIVERQISGEGRRRRRSSGARKR